MNSATRTPSSLGAFSALLAALAVAVTGMLVMAPAAVAQEPAVCEQYPDLPQCVDDTDEDTDTDENRDEDQASPVPGGGGPSASDSGGGGNLPFTGYPVNSLVLLLLGLLAAGAALRGYLAIRERLASRPDGLA